MEVWVTKYIFTRGIYKVKVTKFTENEMSIFCEYQRGNQIFNDFITREGKNWHRTKEEAIARAEQMRLAKIKSLQKSIVKLGNMRFL